MARKAHPNSSASKQPILSAEVLDGSRGGLAAAGSEQSSGVIDAQLVSSLESQSVSAPCTACGSPRAGDSKFCAACGAPLEIADPSAVVAGNSGSSVSAVPNHMFKCQNCGSEVATSLDQRSYVCPFCDSTYVTEISVSRSGRQRPEFVIGFAVTSQDAEEKFLEWLRRNSWFRPGDLAVKAISEKQRGVYLPFWHFSVHAASSWSARIGEYWYRTEHYTTRDSKGNTVRRTRTVTETEWFPLSGHHNRYYHGFLVPATKGISEAEARAIHPFQLASLTRYRPYFLAGWMAEEYSVEMPEAMEKTKEEFRQRQVAEIQRFLPGDTQSNLSVNTEFDVTGSDLMLLPVHVLSYRYRDKVYRFLVNGQTGKVVGEKPYSATRIGVAVAVILAVILIVFVVALVMSAR
ncbi:zinc ribbon domain-containing protein [Aureliella helgolandensis]|uniref:Double zinc ribbon n=1 Tax=Aureliella helgolandensis TaxID=2527968 RepID=A0A518GGE9_9BACT|nr:zinc ribbon domain-containing protein [Aureliella helgolandensis]QDV27675.1 Double zinc ribbon [Aureliella helgolandensis]